MRKKLILFAYVLLFFIVANLPIVSKAEGTVTPLSPYPDDNFYSLEKYGVQVPQYTYTNPDTGYKVYFYDGAKLIDKKSVEEVLNVMYKGTKYGDIGFYTTDETVVTGGEEFYNKVQDKWFGEDSSSVFFIDMEDRYLWLHNYGYMEDCIDISMAKSITDNVYKDAEYGRYEDCAISVFEQVYKVANGEKILRPMKIICNILLSLLMSFFILFLIIKGSVRIPRTTVYEWKKYLKKDVSFTNIEYNFVKTRQVSTGGSSGGGSYRSGGGGGGGGHHSSGGGGGGHHGSGGGHHF